MNWTLEKLGALAELTVGHVGAMANQYESEGVPFLRSLNVKPHRIDPTDLKFINPEFARSLKKSRLRTGDVVTVRTGAPGQTSVIPHWLDGANCSDLVIIRPREKLHPKWLSYHLNWITKAKISQHLVGAVQQHFNVSSAASLSIQVPPISYQRAVAEVLGALDDKIAANEKVIGAADQLALAALEAGVGTETTSLGELAQVTMGTSPSGDTFNEDGVGEPFFQGVRDFGMRSPVVRVWTTKPVRTASIGDVLLSVRAPVGRLNRAHKDLAIGRGLAAIRAFDGDNVLLYYRLRLAEGEWQSFSGDGTLFSSVNRKQIEGIKLRDLSDSSVREVVSSVEGSLRSALDESALLARTRDELLPLLMSGKITVKDAEAVVSDAG